MTTATARQRTACECRTTCIRRTALPDGGWACQVELERGTVSATRASQESGDQAPVRPVDRLLALIAESRCPCRGCTGGLGASDYESWRRCVDCGCHWKATEIGGRSYAAQVRGRCRQEERT